AGGGRGVQAVGDWVHRHVRFGSPLARSTKTAYEAYAEGGGVCRDFTHLALTLCRCLNIPARYATGYLGDIGVPPSPDPMDFSAWFEVYLGGRWYTFDARHNRPRIGRVLMARGRDAADAAPTAPLGSARCDQFTVWPDAVAEADATWALAEGRLIRKTSGGPIPPIGLPLLPQLLLVLLVAVVAPHAGARGLVAAVEPGGALV